MRPLTAFLVNLASKAGHLVRTVTNPYHLATGCGGGGGGGPAPCACNWPTGLATTYTVNGAGAIGNCPSCTDATGGSAWDGTLNHASGCIWWAANANFDPLTISGKELDISYTQILLRTTVSPCRWELYIACLRTGFASPNIWYGYKTTGSTPAGTYTFVGSDCGNTTPTMTVS